MLKLPDAFSTWNTATFKQVLKTEIESLPSGSLPLDKGTTEGGYVDDNNISVTVLTVVDEAEYIKAKLGIFFTEIVICCGCGDDPMPKNTYCEMLLQIHKITAESSFTVIPS